ncbi:MAG TPA: hydrogenase maturation nickel metallochaperone HypA [Syntrophomonas sp.]|nr:hydrogenase maturation nickel metallochaperone HypA [Syntrophomonas sp.]
MRLLSFLCLITRPLYESGFLVVFSCNRNRPEGAHMHELSLIAGMMDLIRNSADKNQITQISRIKLVVGKLSMALPHSLSFAFETLAQEELFKDAELLIEEREICCQCQQCQQQYVAEMPSRLFCPYCGSSDTQMLTGRELFIEFYEGD